MINLIPPARKDSIRFARYNSTALGWIVGILLAILGLIVIAGGGLFYIRQDIKNHEQSIINTEADLKKQNQEETLKRAEEVSGRLSLVVNVLSKEVLFSKLLRHLGTLMPDGAILNNLSLSRDKAGGIDLSISAVNEFVASQALVNLQDSQNLLFSAADTNRITCENVDTIYVCETTIRAVLVEDNPFLILNQGEDSE